MSTQAATVAGGVAGFAAGIVISVVTDIPFVPELGLIAGALTGWAAGRRGARS